MGLDMILDKKVYIGANYGFNHVTGSIEIIKNNIPINVNFGRITYIYERQASWHSARQIHSWFVRNVQEGYDDCKPYEVSGEKLLELVELCKKVLKNHDLAEKLLPNENYYITENYFKELEYTINILSDIDTNSYYEYHASW